MASSDVFPRRNLPGDAEPWGRAIEGRVVGTEKALESANQFLAADNRAFASQAALLSAQINRIAESSIYVVTTRTVTNTTGLNYTSSWSIPAPSWATSALIRAVSITANSNTNTGGIAVTALHSEVNEFSPTAAVQGSLSVTVDNTLFPLIDSSYTAYVPNISGALYNALYYSRSAAGSGSANLNVGVAVTWL